MRRGGIAKRNSPRQCIDMARRSSLHYWLSVLALAAIAAAAPCRADDALVSEVRLGALRHDAGVFGNHKEGGVDGNAEFLFTSPALLEIIWAPRPHVGMSLNSRDNTDQIYAGLTWSFDITGNLFAEFSEGGSVNNGYLDKSNLDRKALGSHLLFRESLSLGWRFDDHSDLSVMLDHISNAHLARYNGGMDGLGLRYGYRF